MRAIIDIVEATGAPQVLREMPYVQDTALDFGLQDVEKNLARAQDLLSRDPIKLYEESGYTLYRLGDDAGFFFMINNKNGRIYYFIEYEQTDLVGFGVGVTQIKLWRSQTFALGDITRKVFFEHLLRDFGCVISDEAQTLDGKKFWTRTMAAADLAGLIVGFYDDGVVTVCDGDYDDWLQQQDAWGEDLAYLRKRFFIKRP
jgi:hypothetical protein